MNAPARYFEDPLIFLETLHDHQRRLQADLADLETRIEAHEAEVCRALRHARRQGVDRVVCGDSAYSEADGRLHVEHWAQAHELEFKPERADGGPWRDDDVIKLGPWPTPATAAGLYPAEVARAADGTVIGERDVISVRNCTIGGTVVGGGAVISERDLPGLEDRSC